MTLQETLTAGSQDGGEPVSTVSKLHIKYPFSAVYILITSPTDKTDRGSHPILQELNIPVYTNQECEARWAPAPIQDDLKALGEGHICLGEETGTKSGCQVSP